MRILADECVERFIIQSLRSNGHEVTHVLESSPGIPDEQVLSLARQLKVPILTADKDFGELVFRQKITSCGVLLYRLHGLKPAVKAEIIIGAIEKFESEIEGNFCVITPSSIRIRKI